MPSNHLILCHPLLLLPSIFPSIRAFSIESALCIRWPNSWSFSFSISPSNEYSGLIHFRIDQLDLLAVQGTLESLVQHHSSKASSLQCSAFFTETNSITSIHDYWEGEGKDSNAEQSRTRCLRTPHNMVSVVMTESNLAGVILVGVCWGSWSLLLTPLSSFGRAQLLLFIIS